MLLVVFMAIAGAGAMWRSWDHPWVSDARHAPLAFLAAAAVLALAVLTPQIWTIATDTGRLPDPPPGASWLEAVWLSRASWTLVFEWYGYLTLASIAIGSLLIGAAASEDTLRAWGPLGAPPRLALRVLTTMEHVSGCLIQMPRFTLPLLFALFAMTWGKWVPDSVLHAVGWDREGTNAFVMLVVFALATTWVASRTKPGRPVRAKSLDRAWSLTSNALLLLVAANELLWIEASSDGLISSRNHFVTTLISVGFTAVAMAHLVDRTRGFDVRPSAVVLVPVAFFVVVTSWDSWIGGSHDPQAHAATQSCEPADDAEHRQEAALRWLKAIDARVQQIPPAGPVFLVAASGGGTRAAIYTGLTLSWMQATSVTCDAAEPSAQADAPPGADAGDSSPHNRVGFLDAHGDGLDRHILLISSVSGGSLGSAYYWSHPEEFALQSAPCPDSDAKHIAAAWVVPTYRALQDEAERHALEAQLHRQAEDTITAELRVKLEKRYKAAFVDEALPSELRTAESRRHVEREFRRLLATSPATSVASHPLYGFPNAPATFKPIGERAVCSTFLDKVGENFASPTIRGALLPFASRGYELEKAWVGGGLLADVAGIQTASASHDRPLLALNAFDVRTGGSVVIGMPALPPWVLHATADDTANGYALPPIAPLDVAEGMDLSLPRAVRASAAVPLAFDPVRVKSSCDPSTLAESDRAHASLTMLDGGAYDNTGIDTLDAIMPVLTVESRQARFLMDGFSSVDARAEAQVLLSRIRAGIASRGGLILVEVDSSARPTPYTDNVNDEETASFAKPGSDVWLGWDALSRATFQHARAATLSMLDSLAPANSLRPRWPPVDQAPDGVVRLVYAPDVLDKPGHDVMSFWALGPTDIAYLLYVFDHSRLTAEPDLEREVQSACDAGAVYRAKELESQNSLADAQAVGMLMEAPPVEPPTELSVAWCADSDATEAQLVHDRLVELGAAERLNLHVTSERLPDAIVNTLNHEERYDIRATIEELDRASVLRDQLVAAFPSHGWPIGLRLPNWPNVMTVVVCGTPPQPAEAEPDGEPGAEAAPEP